MRIGLWGALVAAAGLGCTSAKHPGDGSSGSASGSGVTGTSTGTSGGATGAGTSAGSSAASTTGGTGAGSALASPFADGGFVFCDLPASADAGPLHWLCPPGTYFCDQPGNCWQCRSDADCRNQNLPTFAPDRSHCDLDSGIAGYQGFCQECLANSDCAGKHVGTLCDLSSTYSPQALEPSIITIGFETCGPEETDCRVAGGPDCRLFNAICDPSSGRCDPRSGSCQTDQDCAGLLEPWNPFEVQTGSPYLLYSSCVNGNCGFCPGGICPNDTNCANDAECGNPTSSPLGLTCELIPGGPCAGPTCQVCACTSNAQCGSAWPVCEGLDGGNVNDSGQPIGICSCDSDTQCGDAGLKCLPPMVNTAGELNYTIGGNQLGSSFCGVPCQSTLFPSCTEATSSEQAGGVLGVAFNVCDTASGLCVPCTSDESCRASYGSGGPKCTSNLTLSPVGSCYCADDGDCPAEERCPGFGAGCIPALSRCTPASCGNLLCDVDAGICGDLLGQEGRRQCYSDYDCNGGICTADGDCLGCRDNADCVNFGGTEATLCCHDDPACATYEVLNADCASICHSDQDCLGNILGPHCVADAGWDYLGSILQCGCLADSECIANPNGLRCDTDAGNGGLFDRCGCRTSEDCPVGSNCNQDGPRAGFCDTCRSDDDCPVGIVCVKAAGATVGACKDFCFHDSDCRTDFFCDRYETCRPRCDPGHSCATPYTSCDEENRVGRNGGSSSDADGGEIWCYGCLDSSQCAGELGCDPNLNNCIPCLVPADCVAGAVCLADGLCHPTCDAGVCADGEECDRFDLAGNGPSVCYQCITAVDCPYPQGCDHLTHICGTCRGPTAQGGPYDCPPDSVCSNFGNGEVGVCLPNCDRDSCPADRGACVQIPEITPDHDYCVACLQDSDCFDAGPGFWCDTSINRTFQCEPGLIE